MGFGGSAAAMNETIKRNKALLKRRKTFKDIAREARLLPKGKYKYTYKKASPQQIFSIRERLQKENSKRVKLKILALAIILSTAFASFYYFLVLF